MTGGDLQQSLLVWKSTAFSNCGKVRKINEDAYLQLPELGLWAVADGMGGHQWGDLASRSVTESLRKVRESDNLDDFIENIEQQLQEVNEKLLELGHQHHDIVGSTAAILLAYGYQAVIFWAGDSRIYRLRDGKLALLTQDHNIAEDHIRQGMPREEAERLELAQALTRAVGGAEALDLSLKVQEIRHGDRYLICSDGLYKELNHEEIQCILHENPYDQAAKNLLDEALSREARDNITLVVVEFNDVG